MKYDIVPLPLLTGDVECSGSRRVSPRPQWLRLWSWKCPFQLGVSYRICDCFLSSFFGKLNELFWNLSLGCSWNKVFMCLFHGSTFLCVVCCFTSACCSVFVNIMIQSRWHFKIRPRKERPSATLGNTDQGFKTLTACAGSQVWFYVKACPTVYTLKDCVYTIQK